MYKPKRAKTLAGVACDSFSSTKAAERNLAQLKEAGAKIKMGWGKGAPYDDSLRFHFLDHLHTIRYPSGKVIYACEPYGVEQEDIEELARLAADGWTVRISQMPLWYPGRTTPILISRRGPRDT